jgi:CheY-like chemotaxis protein
MMYASLPEKPALEAEIQEQEPDMKILLIEDSRFLRAAIERSLVKAGHKVIGIADGRDALQVARSANPAVILLDMMLPGLDGTCVLRALKRDASTSHIPVIVLTGLSQKNEANLKKAVAAVYIEKSSVDLRKHPDAMVQAVARLLGIPNAAHDTEQVHSASPDNAIDASAGVPTSEVVA